MNIAVIGTGYVGLVSGTCFADTGNNVICVDIDEQKVERMQKGEVPIYEPGLKPIFDRSIREERLSFTTDLQEAVKDAQVIFLCLPTPPGADGQADLSAVLKVAGQLGEMIEDYKVIVEPEYVESEQEDDSVSLLFLSNLIESKGVYVLLDACQKLSEKGLAFKCTFIGGEGDVSEYQINKEINDRGLGRQVVYAGKKYGEEKEKAFSEADIFVFPTYKECLPLVLIEAMQHSLPVVSTYEGGIRDLVDSGKTGYLVEQKNVEELTQQLEKLIKDKELRQKMGKAGRRKYEAAFTLQKFEERMTEILTQVVQSL